MKIIGGNFGLKGSVWISRDKKLVVDGIPRKAYSPSNIKQVTASQIKDKKFGFLGFIIGALVLSVILYFLFSLLGVVIAIIVATLGSFYTQTQNVIQVDFDDGNSVTVNCTPRFVSKVQTFKNS